MLRSETHEALARRRGDDDRHLDGRRSHPALDRQRRGQADGPPGLRRSARDAPRPQDQREPRRRGPRRSRRAARDRGAASRPDHPSAHPDPRRPYRWRGARGLPRAVRGMMTLRFVRFEVGGQAQPAGSKRAFPFKGKDGKLHATVVDDNPKSDRWKDRVGWAARRALGSARMLEGPLVASFSFRRPRPKGHYKVDGSLSAEGLRNPAPIVIPDALKLARAVEDAMQGVVYRNDAAIVHEELRKRWSVFGEGGVVVVIVSEASERVLAELDEERPFFRRIADACSLELVKMGE